MKEILPATAKKRKEKIKDKISCRHGREDGFYPEAGRLSQQQLRGAVQLEFCRNSSKAHPFQKDAYAGPSARTNGQNQRSQGSKADR